MRKSVLFVISAFVVSLASCKQEIASSIDPNKVTSISLDETALSMYFQGESKTLTARILPETATNKKVTWSSSDKSIVNVSNGTLIPYKGGDAVITVKTEDGGKEASCNVHIIDRVERHGTRTNKSSLGDSNFKNGFNLNTPHQSPASVTKVLNYGNEDATPSWIMSQWWSPFDFKDAEFSSNGSVKTYANTNRKLTVDTSTGTLSMELDAGAEFKYYAETPEDEIDQKLVNRGWPHFLIEQNFPEECRVSPKTLDEEGAKLKVKFDVTIDTLEKTRDNCASDCAQLLFYFRLFNRLQEGQTAEEYGQDGKGVIWVGLPIMDSRYDYVQEYKAMDSGFAGATNTLIYSRSSKEYMGSTKPQVGKKYSIDIDMLETIKDAFVYGQTKGLSSLYKWENISVDYMNLGWEIPGGYKVGATFENFDIYVEE